MKWGDIDKINKNLANKIKNDGIPDCIITILRGGNIPSTQISHLIGVREIYPLLIKRTDSDDHYAKMIKPLVIFSEILDIENKDVLIVDDMLASGETMFLARKIAQERKAKKIRSAVLIFKEPKFQQENVDLIADYIGKKLDTTQWVIFPWEKDQD